MKTSFIKFCILLGLLPIAFSSCSKVSAVEVDHFEHERVIYSTREEHTNYVPTIDASLKDGEEVSILPEAWMNYKNNSSNLLNIDNYYVAGVDNYAPQPVNITWSAEAGANYYLVFVSSNKAMTNYISIFSDEKSVFVKDLYAGTHYYYQIHAYYSDRTIISRRFDFKTADFFRTIEIEGVQNTRDLGNKKTGDGLQKIKQGMVYRGARFDLVTEKGKVEATVKYGIKTDLDLRTKSESGNATSSPLGNSVNYINNDPSDYGSPYYINSSHGIDATAYMPIMRDNLKAFANENNYPVAFHCAIGRDRTGTLAIVLCLLLRIDINQIKQDYLVSLFSAASNGNSASVISTYANPIYNYFGNYNGTFSGTDEEIYQGAEQYCLDIGLTTNEINSIRNILLEDAQQ